jgi:hypothetical protein
MNIRSRRSGEIAARQEEKLLSALTALAITNLIQGLTPENASDYIYSLFFLICSASYLKIRWWLHTGALILPNLAAMVRPNTLQHFPQFWPLIQSLPRYDWCDVHPPFNKCSCVSS